MTGARAFATAVFCCATFKSAASSAWLAGYGKAAQCCCDCATLNAMMRKPPRSFAVLHPRASLAYSASRGFVPLLPVYGFTFPFVE